MIELLVFLLVVEVFIVYTLVWLLVAVLYWIYRDNEKDKPL